jgi:catechol 2,3-dioxygenase-like lactoylglutathione lyase family enzyme
MTRGAINHLAVTVRDLVESEGSFYTPVLEFLGYQKVEDIPQKMTLWVNLAAEMAVNLWQADSARRAQAHARYTPGFHHCAFAVDSRSEVDELHAMLNEKGIPILDAPAEYPQYAKGYYAVFFEDPDGLKYEVVHMPTFSPEE